MSESQKKSLSEILGGQKAQGNPRFTEGQGALDMKRSFKGQVIDSQALENYKLRTTGKNTGKGILWLKE